MDKGELIEKLLEGNRRYVNGDSYHGDVSGLRRKDLLDNGQHPEVCVLTCSDSRVVPEVIFDASLGEIFVMRSAGNTVGEHELGSLQYCVEHLGTKLFVVLAHSHCGAIGATLEGHCHGPVSSIVHEIEGAIGDCHDEEAASKKNALAQVEIAKAAFKGDYEAKAAYYDILSGKVEFLN